MKRALTALSGIIILMISATSFAGECGDINGDNKLNLLDVSYTINHLYRSGPEPSCRPEIGTVTDIDDNLYYTAKIGNQWWMLENLKVTHYRNGDAIPNETDAATWAGLTTGAYCEYNNDVNNVATYGRLYNWYSIGDSRNIAPEGWHVASDAEWQTLIDYLGGSSVAGGKMKEIETTHWSSPNVGATNESGFTALPVGIRYIGGTFYGFGTEDGYWSSTERESGSIDAWYQGLVHSEAAIYRWNHNKQIGFSVRCVKD